MAQFSTIDPSTWDAFYNAILSGYAPPPAPPPTQSVPLSWGTIQLPAPTQSGITKTADPLAGQVPAPPNYRPPNANLPYNGNSIQMFDPFKPEIDQSYLGNLPGSRPKQPTIYSLPPTKAPPLDVIAAYANQDIPQPPALQGIDVADIGPPLPRPRPNTRFDIPLPMPSPLVPNIPPRPGTPVPPMPIPSYGAPIPAPRLARASPPTPSPRPFVPGPVGMGVMVPNARAPGGQAVLRKTATGYQTEMPTMASGKYPVGFTGQIGNGSYFTMFPDGTFHKMMDGRPPGSSPTLLGSLMNKGIGQANSGGLGGLLGLLMGGGGGARPAAVRAPVAVPSGNGGGRSGGGFGSNGYDNIWGDPAISNSGF